MSGLRFEGQAWCFGDDLSIDGDIMALEFAIARETRPEVLREHVMAGIDPTFAKQARPGDLLIAGKRFAQGNPHIQGLLGIAALGLGLLVESIPRGSYRNAINAGLPMLPNCSGLREKVRTGERLRVDFASGEVANLARGEVSYWQPLDPALLDIVAIGGWLPMVRRRIAKSWPAG